MDGKFKSNAGVQSLRVTRPKSALHAIMGVAMLLLLTEIRFRVSGDQDKETGTNT